MSKTWSIAQAPWNASAMCPPLDGALMPSAQDRLMSQLPFGRRASFQNQQSKSRRLFGIKVRRSLVADFAVKDGQRIAVDLVDSHADSAAHIEVDSPRRNVRVKFECGFVDAILC